MNNKSSATRRKNSQAFLLVFFIGYFFSAQAQNNAEVQIRTVFNTLVSAYGNAKSAPKLEIMPTIQKSPAAYYPAPGPVIKVDARFYKLCQTFGKDSLNALSIVLSHELAHYYNDHTFCSDFAFAVSKDNAILASKLKLVSRTEKMGLETQADHKGLFYAAIAGYAPFEIQPQLLDAIYKTYNLKDENIGYPSKTERKEIAKTAQQKAKSLYLVFKNGLKAIEEKKYDQAMGFFEELNQHFPSRENYNNLGVAKVLKVLPEKTISKAERENPERFVYPIQYDTASRLKNYEDTRGLDDDKVMALETLLKSAKHDFEKAISLDPTYTMSYINLACTLELLGNYDSAIGKIKELPKEEQNKHEAQRILAIAYYNYEDENFESKAIAIWQKLKM